MRMTADKLSAHLFELARLVRAGDSRDGRLAYVTTAAAGIYDVECTWHAGMRDGHGAYAKIEADPEIPAAPVRRWTTARMPAVFRKDLWMALDRASNLINREMNGDVCNDLSAETNRALGFAAGAVDKARTLVACDIDEYERQKSMTREEHLNWAKTRAFEYVLLRQPAQAVASLIMDLTKHEAWENSPTFAEQAKTGLTLCAEGGAKVGDWIEAFK